jgi:hypothetical protein
MSNKILFTEKNIEKLLNSSFSKLQQPDKQLKDDTLQLLEQKVMQNPKESQPEYEIIIGLTIVWITFIFLIFTGLKISTYMSDLIKSAAGLSLILIPVSSIILIILKRREYERKMV